MSSTAVRAPVRQPVRQPSRPPARKPAGPSGPNRGTSSRKRKAPSSPAFWFFAPVVIAGLVLLVVAVGALTVQQSYQMKTLKETLDTAAQTHSDLVSQTANLSSPGRIADWARVNGMVTPDEVHILEIPNEDGGQ